MPYAEQQEMPLLTNNKYHEIFSYLICNISMLITCYQIPIYTVKRNYIHRLTTEKLHKLNSQFMVANESVNCNLSQSS